MKAIIELFKGLFEIIFKPDPNFKDEFDQEIHENKYWKNGNKN